LQGGARAEENRFKERYKAGDTPWDIGKPDSNLIHTVTTTPIKPCKALEIGCGTGDNAIWLAQQNFDVLGIDTSEIAIEKAKEKASKANVKCAFRVRDVLASHVEGAPFRFAFDRGCFHTFGSGEERRSFRLTPSHSPPPRRCPVHSRTRRDGSLLEIAITA
jgi:cyclopropane fatty-acyl-phospholipid synthase-like methyltransferase